MHSYCAAGALAAQRRETLTAEADTARLIRQARQGRHNDSTGNVRRMRRLTRRECFATAQRLARPKQAAERHGTTGP